MLSSLANQTIMAQPFQSEVSRRPTFSMRQVTPQHGGRRIGSRLGTITQSIWQLQAVPVHTPYCLKDTLDMLHNFDIYVVFQGLIKKSKSVDFRLSYPPPGLLPVVQIHVFQALPCPWFNCPARPRLVPSLSRTQCFVRSLDRSRFTSLSPRCPPGQATLHLAQIPYSEPSLGQSFNIATSACADFFPIRESLWARPVTNPPPKIPVQMGWIL